MKHILIFTLLFGLISSTHAEADEDPDELYRQGCFAEAEKAYAASDMDHPKDLRYRYNRGCAAYKNSDYQAAMAAFSSVLKRTQAKDPQTTGQDIETLFKTAYNLGNTAFKQGDFGSAAAYYKQAIICNPENEDTKYNLEIALIELAKQKKSKTEEPKTQPQKDSDKTEDQADQSKTCKEGEDSDKSSGEPAQEHKNDKGQTETGQPGKSEEEKATGSDKGEKVEEESPKDLSGELKALQRPPAQQEDDQASGSAISMPKVPSGGIDKKKAEALLDNIKEDRSRFLRFQTPKDKKHGVQSGRDW